MHTRTHAHARTHTHTHTHFALPAIIVLKTKNTWTWPTNHTPHILRMTAFSPLQPQVCTAPESSAGSRERQSNTLLHGSSSIQSRTLLLVKVWHTQGGKISFQRARVVRLSLRINRYGAQLKSNALQGRYQNEGITQPCCQQVDIIITQPCCQQVDIIISSLPSILSKDCLHAYTISDQNNAKMNN